jgi:hypothetical protein
MCLSQRMFKIKDLSTLPPHFLICRFLNNLQWPEEMCLLATNLYQSRNYKTYTFFTAILTYYIIAFGSSAGEPRKSLFSWKICSTIFLANIMWIGLTGKTLSFQYTFTIYLLKSVPKTGWCFQVLFRKNHFQMSWF